MQEKEIKQEIKTLQDNMMSVMEKMDRLSKAIVGDEEFGQEGLVKLVKKHERYIEKQKFLYAKIYGAIAVGGIAWTLILKFWDKLF
tara:strand:- start:642 stop:899 length:258 start_codon:yes stop_codon:yes gene_type:complete